MSDSILIQQPTQPARQLLVLYHGVDGSALDMVPLGQQLAAQFPQAFIVSVQAPFACAAGSVVDADAAMRGGPWFSVQDLTEQNRAARVAQALPAFVQSLQHWQARSGVEAAATAVVGFCQGATMALEAVQTDSFLVARVIALSGRYAALPAHAPGHTTLHLVHGKSDAVVPYGHCVSAAERLVRLGADVTADVIPFLGHAMNAAVMDIVMERLTTHIPKHHWEAVQAAAAQQPGS